MSVDENIAVAMAAVSVSILYIIALLFAASSQLKNKLWILAYAPEYSYLLHRINNLERLTSWVMRTIYPKGRP